MISALINGKVISAPKAGQSAKGTLWCRVTLACPVQAQNENEPDSVVVSMIAFGDEARKLEKLGKGDAVSAVGSAKINRWEKDGDLRVGLDLVATEVLTPYLVRQKRNQPQQEPKHNPAMQEHMSRLYSGREQHRPSSHAEPAFQDDDIAF